MSLVVAAPSFAQTPELDYDGDEAVTGHTWSPKSPAYRANVAGERPIAIAGVSPLAVGLL